MCTFVANVLPIHHRWQCDDLILRKVNSSDASQFAKRYGGSSQCWVVIWSLISLCFMAAGIVAGIAAFPKSFEDLKQICQPPFWTVAVDRPRLTALYGTVVDLVVHTGGSVTGGYVQQVS